MRWKVEHSERAKEFLRTHPHAEEARLTIELLARGELPDTTFAPSYDDETFSGVMGSGRSIWWHYVGDTVVIDEIGESPDLSR